ncbi:MAG: hypothetical protein IT448_10350 [Phycisphaerales bacterium]|nr:hypothetical protein [Phycisphaerales bacterium]
MPQTKKRIKKILLAVALVLLLVAVLASGGLWQLSGTPEWYPPVLNEAEMARAAARAEQTWITAQNQIAQAHAHQITELDRNDPAATQKALADTKPILISFSATELNALYQSWSQVNNWPTKLGRYLEDPRITLHDGRLILVGQIKDLGLLPDTKVSVHFQPQMARDGHLDLHFVKVMGGKLSLPEGLWDSQKQKLLAEIRQHLPVWQRRAKISPDGIANDDLIHAAMGKLLLQVLNHQPGDPVVFVPVNVGGVFNRWIPVKVVDIQIKKEADESEERLLLTVTPLTADQRADLLQRVVKPYPGK